MLNGNLKQLIYKNIKNNFPKNVKHVFAYGSAVMPQKDHKGNMIDLFLIVDNLEIFHEHNLIMNKMHYSSLARNLGSNFISKIHQMGTKVYYNPSIKIENDILIKYGIISENDFVNNLINWNNLFVAGRFHKPVLNIFSDVDNKEFDINSVINKNRLSAVYIFTFICQSSFLFAF